MEKPALHAGNIDSIVILGLYLSEIVPQVTSVTLHTNKFRAWI